MQRYGEISHYRAPYKNSILSGLGADAPAVVDNELDNRILQLASMSVPTSKGMLKLKPEYAEGTLMSLCGLVGGFANPVIGSLGPKDVKDESKPSMTDLLAWMTGRSGAPKSIPDTDIPAALKQAKIWAYLTVGRVNGQIVPAIVLSLTEKDGATCNAEYQKSGRPGCEIFELIGPDDKLAPGVVAALHNRALKSGISTASMLGYGALGVGVAALGILLVGKKRHSSATPNPRRHKRSRRRSR